MSTQAPKKDAITFTRQQYEWLNQQYPELVGSAYTTEAEYRFRAGQRSVIAGIASRVVGESREIGV